MKRILPLGLLVLLSGIITACKPHTTEQNIEIPLISVKTDTVRTGNASESIRFDGRTIYLKKDLISSPISGYVTGVNIQHGDIVKKGEILFELETKENRALNNNSAKIVVPATATGIVGEMKINQEGTYIVEGDILCMLVENSDLLIEVNIPFEYNRLLREGTKCRVILADHTTLPASVSKIMPVIKQEDQTQTVILKPQSDRILPENLNLSIEFNLNEHENVLLLPKKALLSNEKQSDFWVMKVLDDSLAVKVAVKTGYKNDSLVEIISSGLMQNDIVIVEGAYELPDSSIVVINN